MTARAWRWLFSILVAIDILLGAMFLGTRPGETISHAANRRGWEPLCIILDAIDPDHCAKVTY